MTIRKQWLIILILITFIAIIINSFLFSSLTDKYFVNYIKENYEKHIKEIVNYSEGIVYKDDLNNKQISIELEAHLNDPIIGIKLYNENSELIVEVKKEIEDDTRFGMMNHMMDRMLGNGFEETESFKLYKDEKIIGNIVITRESNIEKSWSSIRFKASLLRNSFISGILVLIIAILIGLIISKKMSTDLINTANQAQNVDLGNDNKIKYSKIKEISIIQSTLELQKIKLKLKQKGRKKLIDSLVHQTRTPLTILKTHLEGIEDGIIKIESSTLKMMEEQVENVTAIISNMSSMIDVEKDNDIVNVQSFEFNQLIKQIINGLKVQFNKKSIQLELSSNENVILHTDKYKLSQIIYNILINAYKYTKANGYVKIEYLVKEDVLEIKISDTGMGINEKDLEKIFDAYYRGDIKSEAKGEGIGLYIVKENLNKIFGKVKVVSKENEGSEFTISIPKNI